ncbi:MAG: T9SS type A sorting domain-containing protein [Bacteroidota bacterium]
MKYYSCILLLISSLFLFAFTESSAQPLYSDLSYYPLKMGTTWSYTHYGPYITFVEITDTATIHGNKYYRMLTNTHDDYGRPYSYVQWQRIDNDTVKSIWYNYNDTIVDARIYHLNPNIGDTLLGNSGYYGYLIILVSTCDTVTLPVGTFYNCFHYKHYVQFNEGGFVESWLAPGIGLIKYIARSRHYDKTFVLDSSSLISHIHDKGTGIIVSTTELLENYPNPFNPRTTMRYQIHKEGIVTIDIFDVLGRAMNRLVQEHRNIGTYYVDWNADNLPGGVYFAILRANQSSVVRKMVLQK